MFKNVITNIIPSLFLACILFVSCSDDDPNPPTISLDKTAIDVKAEETNSVAVTYSAETTSATIVVTKYLDDTVSGSAENFTRTDSNGSFNFEFAVTVDDSDSGIVKYNFTITDDNGLSSQTELVVNIELTMSQILLKYDWLLTDEVRVKTGESDINEAYTDDVYRFNEDGTYQKSVGEKADDFGDQWYKHCTWNLDEETGVLKMHRTGAFGSDVYDVMTITSLTKEALEADIVYEGLDIFDPSYDSEEDYVKKMSAQAKGNSFDPYKAGAEDDVEGPSNTPCNPSDFVNN
jgi:hypothetical protein